MADQQVVLRAELPAQAAHEAEIPSKGHQAAAGGAAGLYKESSVLEAGRTQEPQEAAAHAEDGSDEQAGAAVLCQPQDEHV